MRRQLVPGPVVRLTVIKAKTRPGIEASVYQCCYVVDGGLPHAEPANKAGDTPLSLAYKRGHWEVVKYLAQEHQCDPKCVC